MTSDTEKDNMKYFTTVEAISETVAMLQRDGFDLAKVELIDDGQYRTDEDFRSVTPAEWQAWLDTIAAAPTMRVFIEQIKKRGMMANFPADMTVILNDCLRLLNWTAPVDKPLDTQPLDTDYHAVVAETLDTPFGNTQANFDEKLASWLAGCNKLLDVRNAEFSKTAPEHLELQPGRRYIRVVCKDNLTPSVHVSAWAFIDRNNGDVLKADSWKKPAKHARGNIFDADNGLKYVTEYGPNYLK